MLSKTFLNFGAPRETRVFHKRCGLQSFFERRDTSRDTKCLVLHKDLPLATLHILRELRISTARFCSATLLFHWGAIR
ncbi:hypothetical protein EMIT0P260_40082 [Pseudomonas sp. IT-P260]